MKPEKVPLFTRQLTTFLGTMILANIAFNMYQTLLPLYLQNLGANVGQVGLFFTLAAIAPLAFQILGGWLSDSIGRLQAIAIGSLAGMIGYVVYVLAPTWQWVLLSVAATAMATSFVSPSFQAFIAEQSAEENRGRVYGLIESIYMVVGIIGPPLGGMLADRLGFKVMFLTAALLYTMATVGRVLMARRARQQATTAQTARPTLTGLKQSLLTMAGLLISGGVLTWILISDGVRDISFSLAFQLEPLYMQNLMGLSYTQIGWLSSISSVTVMLLMGPGGWLSDKKGERVGIVGGFLLIAAGLAVFLSSRTFPGFAVAWGLFGVGQALVNPAYNALISKVVPPHLRGTAFGLFSTSIGFISLPAPYLGALLWERFSPQTPFYVPLVATLVLLPVMWVKFKLPAAKSLPPVKVEAVEPVVGQIQPASGN